MSTFKDANGNDWTLEINFASVKKLRTCGLSIDLLSIIDEKSPLLARLISDECLLVDIISILLTAQITSKGFTDETFARCLVGEGLQNALDALIQGIANFSRPQRGAVLRKAWETTLDTENKTAERMLQEMEKGTPQKNAMERLEKHISENWDSSDE